jgi:plastocyanin
MPGDATRAVRTCLAAVVLIAGCSDTSESATPSTASPATTPSELAVDIVDLRGKVSDARYPEIAVRAIDSEFVKSAIRVDPGAVVDWTNDGRLDHDIVPAEGGVDFGVDASEFTPGDSYEYQFVAPGVYTYYCSLHGSPDGGMRGLVVVGDVDATVPGVRRPPTGPPETITVPDDQPTIQAAVDHAPEGSLVLVQPGVYEETVTVTTDRLVIRGLDRDRTILEGGHERPNGIVIFADGVAVENLTARNYAVNGLYWDGVTGFRASYVTALDNTFYGVYAFDSRSGIFEHSYAAGSTDSGFYVGQCDPCDALVTDVVAERNAQGFSGANASGVSVVNSTFRSNRAGITFSSLDSEDLAPQHNSLVAGNFVDGTDAASAPRRADGFLDLLYGMGIAIVGGLDDQVVRNRVVASPRVGIAVTPNPAIQENFWPVERTRVEGNVVTSSGMYDIGFVPIPAPNGNCFSGNMYESTAPLDLEAAAPCDEVGTGTFDAGAIDVGAYLALTPPPDPPPTTSSAPPQPELRAAATAPAGPAVELDTIVDLSAITVPAADTG